MADDDLDLWRLKNLVEMVEKTKGTSSYNVWLNKLEEFKRLLKREVNP